MKQLNQQCLLFVLRGIVLISGCGIGALVLDAESPPLSKDSCSLLLVVPIDGVASFSNEHLDRWRWHGKLLPPTYSFGQSTPFLSGMRSVSYIAAAELALEHFRNGDFSVAPDLGLHEARCDATKLPFSTVSVRDKSGSKFPRSVLSSQTTPRTQVHQSFQEYVCADLPVCGVVGPFSDALSLAIGIVPTDFPVVPISARTLSISDKRFVRKTLRNGVSVKEEMNLIVSYLQSRKYVSFMHDSDSWTAPSFSVVDSLEQSATAHNVELHFLPFQGYTLQVSDKHDDSRFTMFNEQNFENIKSIRMALEHIKLSGHCTIVLDSQNVGQMLDLVAQEADALGLIGPSYLWIFTYLTISSKHFGSFVRREVPDSPTDRLLRFSGVIHPLDGFDRTGASSTRLKSTNKNGFIGEKSSLELAQNQQQKNRDDKEEGSYEDAFLSAWRRQNGTMLEKLREKVDQFKGTDEHWDVPDDYFQNTSLGPMQFSSFVYDATMAVAHAACRAVEADAVHGSLVGSKNDSMNDMIKDDMIEGIFPRMLNATFHGASGRVQWNEDYERNVDDMWFGMYNIRPGNLDGTSGKRGYDFVLTSIHDGGGWHDLDENCFIYFDGTANEPTPLRIALDEHFLPAALRLFGTIAMATTFATSLASISVCFLLQRHFPLVPSPMALAFLCTFLIGLALSAVTLGLFSRFDGNEWSQEQLDSSCKAAPWLFVLGTFVMHLSLVGHLWVIDATPARIHGVVRCVAAGVAISAAFCISLLLTWNVQFSVEWSREVVSEMPFETQGQCTILGGKSVWLCSILILIWGMLTLSACAVAVAAWRGTEKIDVASARWTLWAIATQIQVLLVAPSILSTLNEIGVEARRTGLVLLLAAYTIPSMLCIVGPLFLKVCQRTFSASSTRQNSRHFHRSRRMSDESEGNNVSERTRRVGAHLLTLKVRSSGTPTPMGQELVNPLSVSSVSLSLPPPTTSGIVASDEDVEQYLEAETTDDLPEEGHRHEPLSSSRTPSSKANTLLLEDEKLAMQDPPSQEETGETTTKTATLENEDAKEAHTSDAEGGDSQAQREGEIQGC